MSLSLPVAELSENLIYPFSNAIMAQQRAQQAMITQISKSVNSRFRGNDAPAKVGTGLPTAHQRREMILRLAAAMRPASILTIARS